MSASVVPFAVEETEIPGLWVIQVKEITDERGTIREFLKASSLREAGLPPVAVEQVNVTTTRAGAIRGVHGEAMVKYVGIVHGEAFGAYVDLRPDSPAHGKVVTVDLTIGRAVLVSEGIGNAFQSVSDGGTVYLYCFDQEWVPGMAGTAVHPLDPALGIAWPRPVDPADPGQLSAKDAGLPPFQA